MDNTIVISTPPHVKSKRTTRSIMLDVVIALLPCAIMGIVYFGWQALMIELIAVASCVLTEFVYFFIANKGFANKCRDAKAVCRRFLHQFDLSSVVTGLILALILPTTDKWWQVAYEVIIGSVIAIAVVKMLFGGTGKNIVNPAAAARVFMSVSFSLGVFVACNIGAINAVADGILETGATNLSGLLGQNESAHSLLDLFLGTGIAGCIGETSKLAILVGYIYLCVRKVIKWWQPLLYLAVFALVAMIAGGFAGNKELETGFYKVVDTVDGEKVYRGYQISAEAILANVLSGGVVFGAVFMFPDYVTSPKGVYGQICYYALAGVLTALLRIYKGVEVVSFVILIMNLVTPLIDRYLIRKPFGYQKAKKEGK